jgi:hypothetical protein
MSCFRCGKDLPDLQTECDPPCDETTQDSFESNARKMMAEFRANSAEIDWAKIQTPDDVQLFLFTLYGRAFPVCDHNLGCVKIFLEVFLGAHVRINKKHRVWENLKKFCKE